MRDHGLEIHLPHNNFKHYRTTSGESSSTSSSSGSPSPTPSTLSTSPAYPITFSRDDLPPRSADSFPAYASYEGTLAAYHNVKLRALLDEAAGSVPPNTPAALLPAFSSELPDAVLVGGVLRLAPESSPSRNMSTETLVEDDVQRRVAVKIRPARTNSDELSLHTSVQRAEERPGFSSWLSGLFLPRGRSIKRGAGSSRRRS
ncbi:hypothetical protein Q8F55_004518 [Vanrija albida]|uniref:Uncharacterized protein n=1 Tax=Vanrija albida TaxID=181172 RepID=A0ABR3Q6Z2_9TREE